MATADKILLTENAVISLEGFDISRKSVFFAPVLSSKLLTFESLISVMAASEAAKKPFNKISAITIKLPENNRFPSESIIDFLSAEKINTNCQYILLYIDTLKIIQYYSQKVNKQKAAKTIDFHCLFS